jgi:hypothetical protein
LSVFSSPEKPNEAPPVTDNSAAFADTETRAPANAVAPIFLMFILITPLIVIVIINNKQVIYNDFLEDFLNFGLLI